MGWWWSSDPQTPVTKPSDPTPDPVPTSSQPPASPRDVTDKPAVVTDNLPAALSREQKEEQELQSVIAEFQAAIKQDEERRGTSPTTTDASAESSTPADPTLSTFPTTMSCRQAFDGAFYCQSLGGQALNIYRYGEMRSCSENWSDFWFCMRTRSYGAPEKARVVSERYRQKEAKYHSGPSSEDVWEERKPGEELRNPFTKDPDQIEIPGLPQRRKQTTA
ncbi:uncharacterized protein BKCO1_100072 [Diplodia corticola]|uniref:Early meiotic induction protein 1 n=1 Tax=Diplodia corticola TaxID=236234 RepID=A0A1J9SL97_9PEZI|nr:uncharacterized protein BKCO1_100072 [Diplodia corticola]OJD40389.1 hypothetical protein BKCO1_100072 [Diplodia corticola]